MRGNCLELHKETKGGDLHYVDEKKIEIISCFSMVGICPDLESVVAMKNRKEITMHVINEELASSKL